MNNSDGKVTLLPGERIIRLEKEFSYYYRACPFPAIDIYRILHLFQVTDPCLQHAIKKLLVAGGRTAGKPIEKDIDEAMASLTRWKQMREEEKP